MGGFLLYLTFSLLKGCPRKFSKLNRGPIQLNPDTGSLRSLARLFSFIFFYLFLCFIIFICFYFPFPYFFIGPPSLLLRGTASESSYGTAALSPLSSDTLTAFPGSPKRTSSRCGGSSRATEGGIGWPPRMSRGGGPLRS